MKKWVIRILIIFMIYAIYDFLDVRLDELPEGEFLSEHPSPNYEYTARAYLLVGGSLDRAAIRVEIDFGKKIKTIYWNYDEHTADIRWINNETIEINEHKLNIFNDTYHWKKDPKWEENRGRY